jgi:hypothetical protein
MQHLWKKGVVIACALSVSACASIVGGRYEKVQVATSTDGQNVHANCTLSNGISQVSVTTPATASIHRSSYDLQVVCQKDGRQISQQTYDSGIYGMVWGNFVLGGAIGIGIDFYNGAARSYPDELTVQLPASYTPMAANTAPLASMDGRVSKTMFNAAQNTAAAHQCDRAIHVVMVDGSRAMFRSQCPSSTEVQIQCAGTTCTTAQPMGIASNG